MKRILFWVVHNIPLGNLTPYVLGLALGRKPHRVKSEELLKR